MRFRTLVIGCLALCAAAACTHEKDGEIPPPTQRASSPASGPDAEVLAQCDQAADGTPCGERGRGLHCLFNACVRNACGDGVRAEDEECDDGNERSGDGCNERCVLESCGNGAVDLGEECDDGNNASADGCTARCRVERCGNRVIDPGEECDDGNSRDDDICSSKCKTQMLKTPDAGSAEPGVASAPGPGTVMDAGGTSMDAATASDTGGGSDSGERTADSGAIVPVEAGPADLTDRRSQACKTCLEAVDSPCRDFQGTGTDLVAGCFKQDDAAWTKKCSEALFCSLNAGDLCAGDLTRGAVSCYCGLNRTIDNCFKAPSSSAGPVGACIPQWEQAGNCAAGDFACVSSNFVMLDRSSGFAATLITCALTECASACWNPATGLIRDADASLPGDSGAGSIQDN